VFLGSSEKNIILFKTHSDTLTAQQLHGKVDTHGWIAE
jgi:hypothetical protein